MLSIAARFWEQWYWKRQRLLLRSFVWLGQSLSTKSWRAVCKTSWRINSVEGAQNGLNWVTRLNWDETIEKPTNDFSSVERWKRVGVTAKLSFVTNLRFLRLNAICNSDSERGNFSKCPRKSLETISTYVDVSKAPPILSGKVCWTRKILAAYTGL